MQRGGEAQWMIRATPVNGRTQCLLPGLLLQGEHLLLLVLVVVHLGTLSQRLVPRLWREQEQVWGLGLRRAPAWLVRIPPAGHWGLSAKHPTGRNMSLTEILS